MFYDVGIFLNIQLLKQNVIKLKRQFKYWCIQFKLLRLIISKFQLFFLELKVSPDVAGATFMAAGSSAPELATVVIGVFLAKDDIGVSGVIGSAVFNIMFVIAICGLASTTVTYLNWWPLCRDSFFYTISILIMLLAIYNETISWY